MAGLIGTLASGVVVSSSNFRSLKAAGKYVTHNWKIKVDEISVEVDCIGKIVRGEGKIDENRRTKLKWTSKFEEQKDNGKKLMNGEVIEVNSEVGLWASEDNEELWHVKDLDRAKKVELTISEKDKKIQVELKEARDNSGAPSALPFGSFNCEINWISNTEGLNNKTYKAKFERMKSGMTGSIITEDPARVSVRLGLCEWKEREKQFECALKVTYENNLDLSKKVVAKARISFP